MTRPNKKCYVTTENHVKSQIWIAMSVYAAIPIIKKVAVFWLVTCRTPSAGS